MLAQRYLSVTEGMLEDACSEYRHCERYKLVHKLQSAICRSATIKCRSETDVFSLYKK